MSDTTKRDVFQFFDKHFLIIAAQRYCIGRMTAASHGFACDLAMAWKHLPENTKSVIKEDIDDYFKRDDEARILGDKYKPLGMDCDREAWDKVRKAYHE